jgi:hypothetical protein
MPRLFLPILLFVLALATLGFVAFLEATVPIPAKEYPKPKNTTWDIQSVDTMKYSRDLAREKLNDPAFDRAIDAQMRQIAGTGANFVAIATPYDDEFLPFLRRWVASARRHGLRVWFRGNFSGWEGWFGYPRMTREEHLRKTGSFIRSHPDLFEDGDVFSSCPECENGGPGDPRRTGDVDGHRRFLVEEYRSSKEAFRSVGKNVRSGYFSMNGDVARLVMDRATTDALGNVVVIDHYVKDPARLVSDVRDMADRSGGRVVLGETGAPVPDIHGVFSETDQAAWLRSVLAGLAKVGRLDGVNYWTGTGGSTALWSADRALPAAAVLASYYRPRVLYGSVEDESGAPIEGVRVGTREAVVFTDANGTFRLPAFENRNPVLRIYARGFVALSVPTKGIPDGPLDIVVKPESERFFGLVPGWLLPNSGPWTRL